MRLQFYPDEDMLYVGLADVESIEGAEVTEGVVFHYDAEGRLVSIEIDEASRRVNLEDIRRRSDLVAGAAGPPRRVLTTVEVAEELGVTPFAVQKIRKVMKEAGVEVGIRPDLPDSLLSPEDLEKIRMWREEHPRGRPRKTATVPEAGR